LKGQGSAWYICGTKAKHWKGCQKVGTMTKMGKGRRANQLVITMGQVTMIIKIGAEGNVSKGAVLLGGKGSGGEGGKGEKNCLL